MPVAAAGGRQERVRPLAGVVLDLVLWNTSPYFEGAGGHTLGRHGQQGSSPDLRQMILATLIDGDGRPVCSEIWPAMSPTSPR